MRRVYAVMVFFAGGGLALATPADAEIVERLPGRWTTAVGGGAEAEANGTIRYDKAGLFMAEGSVKIGEGEKADVRLEGTWKVAGGCILHRVTKSSHPGLAPVGAELKEHVLAIDAKELRIKRGAGKERVRDRVKD
jgi:hypothetical protein